MGYSDTRDSVAAQVKEQADIVKIIGECVDLKRAGASFLGRCPFHGEKTPSFNVHPVRQFYHCFGCGESGDVFTFMMKYHNMDFPAALKALADRYHITLPERSFSQVEQERERLRKSMYAVNDRAMRLFREYLLQAAAAASARAYLERRGIPMEMQEKFQLGYAPAVENAGWNFLGSRLEADELAAAEAVGLLVRNERGTTYDRFRDRVLFPIFDVQGRVSGFGGRIIGEGQPKYMNSPESLVYDKSRLLLGLYQQSAEIRSRQRAVLVEGNFDLLSLVVHGCPNVVAPLGTALTRPQLKLLRHYAENVTLLFDGDAAGIKAAIRAVPLFLAEQMSARVALLPSGEDPDTFVRKQGLDELERLLERATPLAEFCLERLIEEHGLTLDGKSRIVEELRPLVQAAASPLQRSVVVAHFGEKLGIAPRQLEMQLGERSQSTVSEGSVGADMARPSTPVRRDHVQLSAFQKSLVEHMILFPRHFKRLEEAGLRERLAGGIGEVLFLQIRELCEKNQDVDPEELRRVLPEGEERSLVSHILDKPNSLYEGMVDEQIEGMLDDLLEGIKKNAEKDARAASVRQIKEKQASGGEDEYMSSLQEHLKNERERRGLG